MRTGICGYDRPAPYRLDYSGLWFGKSRFLKERKGVKIMRRKTPEPELISCITEYGGAYCWRIQAHGIYAIGNTKLDCCVEFLTAYESEYGKPF
jgi:hypothetical protein